jgi:hypothetical protein
VGRKARSDGKRDDRGHKFRDAHCPPEPKPRKGRAERCDAIFHVASVEATNSAAAEAKVPTDQRMRDPSTGGLRSDRRGGEEVEHSVALQPTVARTQRATCPAERVQYRGGRAEGDR